MFLKHRMNRMQVIKFNFYAWQLLYLQAKLVREIKYLINRLIKKYHYCIRLRLLQINQAHPLVLNLPELLMPDV